MYQSLDLPTALALLTALLAAFLAAFHQIKDLAARSLLLEWVVLVELVLTYVVLLEMSSRASQMWYALVA